MADVIKVTPEQLKSAAASLGATGNSIKSTTSEMLSLVTGISTNVWQGEASSSFVKRFQGMQSDITRMCKRLDEQSKHLDTIAAQYRSSEEANKAMAARVRNQFAN